ncbi:putative non-specific serine/threonine protein kinase [Helianthus debilis subsp. tardiflorus]
MHAGSGEYPVIMSGNMIISVQVLKNATKNFAKESELRHGWFGVVYKGQLDDGTKIFVKRMESGAISNKALDEFESEISVRAGPGVGGEDHRPGPKISEGTLCLEKNSICIRKIFFFNRVYLYKHQHRSTYKTIVMN